MGVEGENGITETQSSEATGKRASTGISIEINSQDQFITSLKKGGDSRNEIIIKQLTGVRGSNVMGRLVVSDMLVPN